MALGTVLGWLVSDEGSPWNKFGSTPLLEPAPKEGLKSLHPAPGFLGFS